MIITVTGNNVRSALSNWKLNWITRQKKKMTSPSLYKKIGHLSKLNQAWASVRKNGLRSTNLKNKEDIESFSKTAPKRILGIKTKLKKRIFKFEQSHGVPVPKKSGGYRGIVVSPIENRIVQRSLLLVLQELPHIRKKYLSVSTSFGGLIGRNGVREAISKAHNLISSGNVYFIRSDIKDFFTKIPREKVLNEICSSISDSEFVELLHHASETELSNLSQVYEHKDIFPIYDEGIAQGSSLSPLLANAFLNEFDTFMNDDDVHCLRFMDDFLLLGTSMAKIETKFSRAKSYLHDFGMSVYNPREDKNKSGCGHTKNGFDFLGCEIKPHVVSPSKQSISSFLEKIKRILSESTIHMVSAKHVSRKSFAQTLVHINHVTRGWGKHYVFCNNPNVITQVQVKIDKELTQHIANFLVISKERPELRPYILGTGCLRDIELDPIIRSKKKANE